MMDLHPPEGVDAPGVVPCVQHDVPHLYDIPLASCISRDVPNLMFAGRNISATHVAFASTRVMATCAAMGQGVGVSAAHAVLIGTPPVGLVDNTDAIYTIQQQLLRDDVYLIGTQNEDPREAGRRAGVIASSELPEGRAVNIVSGQTRSTHGRRGVPPARSVPGTHRWMSDPAAGLPAWILLQWESPVAAVEVQLVFDTGLHRHFPLSHHDRLRDHGLGAAPTRNGPKLHDRIF